MSLLEIVKDLFNHSHTFYPSDRSSPIKGEITAVGPRNIVVRTNERADVKISLSALSKKDRAYVDLWLKRHPLPRIIEIVPDIKLSVKKRIDVKNKASEDDKGSRLELFFDVLIENLTEAELKEVAIAYTLFSQDSRVNKEWEAVSRGELKCSLKPRETQTHSVAGALHGPDGGYDSSIHRILVYGLISGNIAAQASDSPELLRYVCAQNANQTI